MVLLRFLLLVLANSALVAVAPAAPAQLPNSGGAAGCRREAVAAHPARPIPLGLDYRLAGDPATIRIPTFAAIATTIPEPPLGASLAGAAVIGFVYWTRRQRT